MEQKQQKQYDYLLNILIKQPQSEIQLQSKCAELLYWFYPNEWRRFVCIHNNDRRANTSNIGIVPGASDTFWIGNKGIVIFMEFKFGNNKQGKDQVIWESIINIHGHRYHIVNEESSFWQLIGFKQPVIEDILKLKWFL